MNQEQSLDLITAAVEALQGLVNSDSPDQPISESHIHLTITPRTVSSFAQIVEHCFDQGIPVEMHNEWRILGEVPGEGKPRVGQKRIACIGPLSLRGQVKVVCPQVSADPIVDAA